MKEPTMLNDVFAISHVQVKCSGCFGTSPAAIDIGAGVSANVNMNSVFYLG